MAFASRLILSILLLIGAPGVVFAQNCDTPDYYCTSADYSDKTNWGFSSGEASANSYIATYNAGQTGIYRMRFHEFVSETLGKYNWRYQIYQTTNGIVTQTTASSNNVRCVTGVLILHGGVNKCLHQGIPECPVNQEFDEETSTCTCKHGPAGAFAVTGDVMMGCNDGCTIYLTAGSYSNSTNKTYGSWNQNGMTCTPSPDSPGVDSPDSPSGQDAGKCPTGQCPGTVNGTSVCVPCKGKEGSDSSSSENTTDTPSGASAPSGSSSSSSSGSKSTECEGGVCVTKEKVVVINPDGSTTEKEKETTESLSEFCTKNPRAAICKAADDSSWGGACSGGFQCKGDAVQCAQAQAAWKAACLLDVGSDDPNVVKGGQAMSSDQSALRAQLGLDDTGDDFNLSSMIDSDPLFAAGGGCPADQQVTLLGQSLTLSLSPWCSWLQTAGTILQAAAYLAAALIVFRRG